MEDWDVIIHDHHPAYISWDQYLKTQKQIEKNASPPKSQASQVAREGSALLQGLARCGNCGRPMHVTYHGQGKKSYPYYICNMAYRNFSDYFCQSIGGRRIDQAVSDAFLDAISPDSLNIPSLKPLNKSSISKIWILLLFYKYLNIAVRTFAKLLTLYNS